MSLCPSPKRCSANRLENWCFTIVREATYGVCTTLSQNDCNRNGPAEIYVNKPEYASPVRASTSPLLAVTTYIQDTDPHNLKTPSRLCLEIRGCGVQGTLPQHRHIGNKRRSEQREFHKSMYECVCRTVRRLLNAKVEHK